ncbi:uncharacterized protein N7479_003394 [Penicillium vulpinum]|uniref:Uncharacterized protein n=1 Tax=Penicillium vulpinum TaxID=29845 RepID=A0A1V6RE36_9EURO|nr:uncharacterized protein N7479_003394 [Penicillium vulpinum]KAJ5963518.1 hypothetical protein N7479_003394 [Penicillium vulpinum]OQE00062.1 hypothetical protein PENVUL_c059G02097 [Penicillium vulpinum]
MCHSVTWYFAMCQHPDPGSTSLIACNKSFKQGYECTGEHRTVTPFPLEGSCLQCRFDQLIRRLSIFRELRRQRRWSEICDALQYSDEDDSSIDGSEAEEPDMETQVSQSPSLTSRAENRETRASFHPGPTRIPVLVQPSSSHLPSAALVEYADDSADNEDERESEPLQEPQPQTSRAWCSRIPRPTRLVRNQQHRTYLAFIADDNMLDIEPLIGTSKQKENPRTWRS